MNRIRRLYSILGLISIR